MNLDTLLSLATLTFLGWAVFLLFRGKKTEQSGTISRGGTVHDVEVVKLSVTVLDRENLPHYAVDHHVRLNGHEGYRVSAIDRVRGVLTVEKVS